MYKQLLTKINKIKTDSFWKALFKNSFWAFLGDSLSSVIVLIVTIILINKIGSDSYAIIVLAQSYMSIFDVAINIQSWKGVIQYGQKAVVAKDINLLNGYVKLGTILDISTAILCGIISMVCLPLIGNIFDWNKELIVCCFIFCFSIFSHFSGTPTAILRITDKFSLVALQKFLSALIKLIAIVLCIYLYKFDLYKITFIYCLTDIIGNLLLVIFAFYVYNKKYNVKEMLKSKMPYDKKEFLKFTIWGTLSDVVDIPVNYLDVFLISMLGDAYVSIFKVFKQLAGIVSKVTSPIQQSIMPQLSQLSAEGKKKRGFKVVNKIRNAILAVGMPCSILVGLTSPFWLKYIYGVEYSNYWYVLLIFLIVQVIALSYTAIHPYFLSLNKSKKSAIIILIGNIIYLLLAFLLIKPIGMLGIILAYLVQILTVIGLKVYYIKKYNREGSYENK